MGWMCQAGQVPSAIEQSSQPATKWRKVKIQKKTNKFPSDNLNLIFSTHWWCVLNRPAISINKTGSANFLSVIHWPGGWLQSLPATLLLPDGVLHSFARRCICSNYICNIWQQQHLTNIHIFIPKCTERGVHRLGNIPKKKLLVFTASHIIIKMLLIIVLQNNDNHP